MLADQRQMPLLASNFNMPRIAINTRSMRRQLQNLDPYLFSCLVRRRPSVNSKRRKRRRAPANART